MTAEIYNIIGGKAVAGARTFEKTSPVSGRVVAQVHEADAAIIDQAVLAAREAFDAWSRLTPVQRAVHLERIADAIEAHADEFARLEAEDIGRPIRQVRAGHVARTIETFRLYAEEIRSTPERSFHGRALSPNIAPEDAPPVLTYTVRQPKGVVAVIAPWNVPLLLLALNVAPALAAGNCVVAKPSEESPSSAALLARMMHEAGLPPGVFNVVQGFGSGSAGEALTHHPSISAFGFTGEGRTATAIMKAAAEGNRGVLLELGGKNPGIIFADADLPAAIAGAAAAAFTNTGQVCLSVERLYVECSVFDQVVEGVAAAANKLVLGAPDDPNAALGPLISRRHRDHVLAAIDRAKADGAQLVTGGDVPTFGDERDGGAFIRPAVLTGLDHRSAFLRDEVFGPVLHIAPFVDEDEAIRLANDTEFGLASMTWTKDLARAHRCAGAIRAGLNWVNCWQVRDLRTPLEGHGKSGLGAQGGRESLDFYSSVTTVTMAL